MLSRSLFAVLALLCAQAVSGRTFDRYATLGAVPKTGFYRVGLPSALRASARPFWEDLRLLDASGREVPYLLESEMLAPAGGPQFTAYPVRSQESRGGRQTIVIENAPQSRIDNIVLELKNADAARTISLSGGNDGRQWFTVRDELALDAAPDPDVPEQFRTLRFPLTDYRFYRIEILNGKKPPLNVLRAGFFYARGSERPLFLDVAGLRVTQRDSNRHSYVSVRIGPANVVDRLQLRIEGPARFFRHAVVRGIVPSPDRRGRRHRYVPDGMDVDLSSEQPPVLDLSGFADKKLEEVQIEIDNKDDAPLRIGSVSGMQLRRTLVAQLAAGGSYRLAAGNPRLRSPEYDLDHFREQIPSVLPELQASVAAPVRFEAPHRMSPRLIWIGIAVAAAGLLGLTSVMLRDMRKG